MGKNLVVTLTEEDWLRVKAAVLDRDANEALKLLKKMVKQVEQQEARGLKSHLG
jgi:pyrroloquinoline quinone (PQQ) biosynthesis protein C